MWPRRGTKGEEEEEEAMAAAAAAAPLRSARVNVDTATMLQGARSGAAG